MKMGGVFASLDRDDDLLTVGLNRAVDVLAQKLASVRTLGPHPADKEPVLVRKGRFGPYVQHGNMVANLPRDLMMDDVTIAQATELLATKGKMLKPKGRKGRGGKLAKAPAKAAPKAAGKSAPKAATKAAAAPAASVKPKPAAKAKPKAKAKTKAKAKAPAKSDSKAASPRKAAR